MAEETQNETQVQTEDSPGLISLMRGVFTGFNPDDKHNHGAGYEVGRGATHHISHNTPAGESEQPGQGTSAGASANDYLAEHNMPVDRFAKYQILQEMSRDPILNAALDMHIAHALSLDSQTGRIISIEATSPEFTDLAAEIMRDLGGMLNERLPSWAKICAMFGVSYIRPYAERGRGIFDFESDYYTLPVHVREYVRGGNLAGFTSEHLKEYDSGGNTILAEPWALVSMKIPYWQPNIDIEPDHRSGQTYSLYTDLHRRVPIETQDYGTSLMETSYGAWMDLKDSLKSLRGSRYNASRLDRFVTLGMDNMDPTQAASYLRTVGAQIRQDLDAETRIARKKGIFPTIMTSLIPTLAGTKGGVNIDTHSTPPDIAHIEDVMFHLKRVGSSVGIDASMLGWADMLAGGLGEGGFFQTSIQAAMRANWLRIATRTMVHRIVDIHLAYKHGKVYPDSMRPYEIKFHSLNTAIENEQADAMETRSTYATNVAVLLDTIENSPIAKSDTFKNMVLTDILKLDEDKAKSIMSEFAAAAVETGGESFMESVGFKGSQDDLKEYVAKEIYNQLLNISQEA